MHIANIDEHLGSEYSASLVHLLEHTVSDLEISDHVPLGLDVEPNSEMPTVVLLALSLVSERNNKVINNNSLFIVLVLHHGLSIVGVVLDPVGSRSKEGVTVKTGARALLFSLGLHCSK